MKEKFLFNDGWEFQLTQIGTMRPEAHKEWEKVEIPHDWLIWNVDALYKDGDGWYRKYFAYNSGEGEEIYYLRFDGVYMDSTIWINEEVFSWKYGYSTFTIDCTAYLSVSVNGNDEAKGTEGYPFRSISRAAAVAVAGDTITVHAGIYREWVSPENGGTDEARIVYQAAGDGETVITGAEPINEWKNEEGNVWSIEVSNSIFTVRNPYKEELYGDWLFEGAFTPHLGDVYLDGKSLYECASYED